MEMSGERVIAAERAAVWAALNDPEVLKACIPGCQSMERTGDNGFAATVKQKVGPVSATFNGEVELSDIVEGESYRISGEGKGGAAGFAKGGAAVRLEDVDVDGAQGTKLSYDVEAKVGGKLAQLGSRLIDGFAKRMADQFFDRFKAELEGPAETAAAGEAGAATPEGDGGGDGDGDGSGGGAKKSSWFKRVIGV